MFDKLSRVFEKDKVLVGFQKWTFSSVFWAFESFLCPLSIWFGTDTKSMQGHGSGINIEIYINRMLEYMRS